MITFPAPEIQSQSVSSLTRRMLPFFVRKVILPLAVLALFFFWDYPLRAVVQNQQSPFLDHFFNVIKFGGNVIVGFSLAFVLIGVGKFAYKVRLLRAGKLMLVSLVFSNLAVLLAKPVLDIHPRNDFEPQKIINSHETRWGRFPSGDTTVAFSIAASLSAEYPPLMIPCFVLGGLVGVERVYFNLHFFSDVFAGAWLGVAMVGLLQKKYFSSKTK